MIIKFVDSRPLLTMINMITKEREKQREGDEEAERCRGRCKKMAKRGVAIGEEERVGAIGIREWRTERGVVEVERVEGW